MAILHCLGWVGRFLLICLLLWWQWINSSNMHSFFDRQAMETFRMEENSHSLNEPPVVSTQFHLSVSSFQFCGMVLHVKYSSSLNNLIFLLIRVFWRRRPQGYLLLNNLFFLCMSLELDKYVLEIRVIFTKETHQNEQEHHIYELIYCLSWYSRLYFCV